MRRLLPATTTASCSTARDAWPDPCSRWQPQGSPRPLAASRRRRLRLDRRGGRRSRSTTSSSTSSTSARSREEGTFDGVIPRLAGLRELGVTAIELMPVATFPGSRGWGYDGLYLFAPHTDYGGPKDSRGSSTPRTRGPRRRSSTSSTTTSGPGNEALAGVRPVLHRPVTRPRGATRSTSTRARRARVGDPERRALGPRLRRRRPPARRGSRRSRTTPPATCSPSWPSASTPSIPRALVISEMELGRLPAAPGVGPRRDVARQPPPRAARCPDRGAGRLLRGLRRLNVPHRGRLSRPEADADRGVRPEPRPGRQPRARRPASAGEAAPGRGCRALQPLHAAPLPGRGVRRDARRSSTSPTTATRSSPTATREGRRREFAHFAGFAGEVPDPQDAATSSAPGSTPRATPEELYVATAPPAARAAARAGDRQWTRRPHARASPRRAPTLRRGLRQRARSSSTREALARASVSARPGVGRRGNQLLALLRARREGRALPLRRGGPRDALRAHRAHGVQLARLPLRASARASATATASTAPGPREHGQRFNPAKLLIDPYAKSIEGPILWDRGNTLPVPARRRGRRSRADDEDDSRRDPEVVVIDAALRLAGRPAARRRPWNETVIYEVHVEGVHEADRGRARGAARHLRRPRVRAGARVPPSLGVTAVELLPIHHIADEPPARAAGSRTTGATARSATSRRTRSTRRPAGAASR